MPRIVGGHLATHSKWPWMTALVVATQSAERGQFCAGSLVAPQWVITAAHCVKGNTPAGVDVLARSTWLGDTRLGLRVRSDALVTHPAFNARTQNHDAALIHLVTPLPGPYLHLASIRTHLRVGQPLQVAGWGQISTTKRIFDDRLRSVEVRTIPAARCHLAYGEAFSSLSMLCVSADHGKDSCYGDSGGPLISRTVYGPSLVGLVSFGNLRCADPRSPGVYTRVTAISSWALRIIYSHAPDAADWQPSARTRA